MTVVCPHCGGRVQVGSRGYVVLSCTPVLTPYRRPHQVTRIERFAHGLGALPR